jgi:hypothetical protein
VAQSAIGGESRGHVSGIRGSGKVRLVAAVTGRRQRGVVVVYMARCAGNGGVGAGQRERRCVVIEGGAGPIRSAVASGARGGEPYCGVRRIRGPVPIRRVTGIAIGRQCGVVVVYVARCAGNGGVGAGERECGVVVIEGRRCPAGGRVADGAIGGEPRGHVSGICGSGEIRLVAAVASRGQRCVVVVGVARGASHGCVSARKWESSVVVIKGCRGPRSGIVASLARSGEAG